MSDPYEAIMSSELGNSFRNARAVEIVRGMVARGVAGEVEGERAAVASAWAQVMGEFRFYSNRHVDIPTLYDACRAQIRERLGVGGRCFLLHDHSVVDYSGHNSKEDRIPVGDGRGRGYDLYTAFILDANGVPLGPLMQELHTSKGVVGSESTSPKQFVGMIEQMEDSIDLSAKHLPASEIVDVADRGFDDVLLLRTMTRRSRRYVIRAQKMRRHVLWGGRKMAMQDVVDRVVLQRTGTVDHRGETFERWVGETTVTMDGRSWRGRHRGAKPQKGEPIDVRVVVAELRRADGSRETQWALLTNLEDDADSVARIYVWRWKIERYFYLKKVGFQLETWTQIDGERIARRLALTSLAAMIIYELQGHQSEPETAEAIRVIATMGGWLGRKRDPIGPIVLMRGMFLILSILEILETYDAAQLKQIVETAGLGWLRRPPRPRRSSKEG